MKRKKKKSLKIIKSKETELHVMIPVVPDVQHPVEK